MPRLTGILRKGSKADEIDWAEVESRMAARLAALFQEAGDPEAAAGDARKADEVAPAHPAIHVVGEPVGVMDPEAVERPALDWLPETANVQAAEPAEVGTASRLGGIGIGIRHGKETVPLAPATKAVPRRRTRDPGADASAIGTSVPHGTSGTRSTSTDTAWTPSRARALGDPAELAASPMTCPYCAMTLDPAPTLSRRCPHCRHRIVVKRLAGRPVYLTEDAVVVFEAERQRVADAGRWSRERDRWLRLAASVDAWPQRRAQLAVARPTEETVAAARKLYLSTVDRGFRTARRERRWGDAARIRREQALALYRLAGSPKPPSEEILTLYREGVNAELRGIAEISREAELRSASCCPACRADDGQLYRISQQVREPLLPHAECPRGLCRCSWDLPERQRSAIERYMRRRPRSRARIEAGTTAADASEEPAAS